MVAIIPRSFGDGPYFEPFRRQFFAMMRLRHVHLFEKPDQAVKGGPAHDVTIKTSCASAFEFDPARDMSGGGPS